MKKFDPKNIAMLGLAAGLAFTAAGNAEVQTPQEEVASKKPLTSSELYSKLSPSGKKLYDTLDEKSKALALQLANQTCKGQNTCKGLNSCKSENNSCAGQAGCRGQAAAPFKDKDVAVKVASMHMLEKRKNMQNQ